MGKTWFTPLKYWFHSTDVHDIYIFSTAFRRRFPCFPDAFLLPYSYWLTRQTMHVQGNTEARPFKHCCSENKQVLHIPSEFCSLANTACNADAPHCHMWPFRMHNIFPHYLINGKILKKRYWTYSVYFDFLHSFEAFFEKCANINFHNILFSGSRVVPCERTDMA
jgi:hypothetical protein